MLTRIGQRWLVESELGKTARAGKLRPGELETPTSMRAAAGTEPRPSWAAGQSADGTGQTPDNRGSEELAMGAVERAHRNLRPGTQGAARSAELEGEQR
jgi:hypothetical protein